MSEYDVLCLQQQIEQECQKARRCLAGRFVSTRHELWSQAFRQVDNYHEQLIHLVGKQQASTVMCEISLGERCGRACKRRSPLARLSPVLNWLWSLCTKCPRPHWRSVEDVGLSASREEAEGMRKHMAQKGDYCALQE